MPPDRQPRTTRIVRVRTGCWTCRRRKKKCDEVRPICGGCGRNDLSCSWPTSIPGRENEFPGFTEAERHESVGQAIDELKGTQMPVSPASQQPSSSSPAGGRSAILWDGLGDGLENVVMQEENLDHSSAIETVDNALMVGNLLPRNLSMLPGYNADSYQLLSHYLSTTADCMANGSTPINPFLVQIVPLAFTSDLLLQLVITQSAAHRAFRRRDETDAIAHSHYAKALQSFRRGVTEFIEGKESNPLMLLVGALVMCFTEVSQPHHSGFSVLTACRLPKATEREQSLTIFPQQTHSWRNCWHRATLQSQES